jgi:hypothetical protein
MHNLVAKALKKGLITKDIMATFLTHEKPESVRTQQAY